MQNPLYVRLCSLFVLSGHKLLKAPTLLYMIPILPVLEATQWGPCKYVQPALI